MAFFEQQQAFVGEIVEFQRGAFGERVVLRNGEQELFLEQEFGVQLIVVDRQREDAGIEPSFAQLAQHHFGFFLDEQQLQPRKTFADARDHVRQQIRSERRENAETDRARFRIARAPRDGFDLIDLVEHFARALRDFLADFGEQDFARRALDQRHFEFFLELLDLRRQRRLADETGFRGAAEMLVFGERNQISEIADVHRITIDIAYRNYTIYRFEQSCFDAIFAAVPQGDFPKQSTHRSVPAHAYRW